MARYDVKPGSTSSGMTLGNGSIMYVSSAGTAIETILNAGTPYTASMVILDGGKDLIQSLETEVTYM